MRVNLYQALLGASLLTVLGCTGGGDSKAPIPEIGNQTIPSATTPVFDPANAKIPLPNVLATAAARFRDEVEQVRLLTPDKDLGQCLAGDRVVQVDRVRHRVIDEAALLERRGLRPSSVPDFLALVGDDADGYPGLPGFGEKTAAALLGAFGRLEGIPRDPAAWPAGLRGADRLSAVLAARWDDALLFRRLATLVTTVPLAESLEDLRWRGLPRAVFEGWCARVGAGWLLRAARGRPSRWA